MLSHLFLGAVERERNVALRATLSKHFLGRGRGFSTGVVQSLAMQIEEESLRLRNCEDADGVFYCPCCDCVYLF